MRRAYTLVELVVVLFLLGLSAAAVAPALAPLVEDDPVREGAEEVARVLRSARRSALERGEAVAVVLEPASGRYWVRTAGADPVPLAEGAFALREGVALSAESPRARLSFAPSGAAAGGPVTVHGAGRARTLRIERWTGDIRVESR